MVIVFRFDAIAKRLLHCVFTIPFNEKKGEMVIVFRRDARKRREHRVSTIPFKMRNGDCFSSKREEETRASRLYNPIQ